MLLLLLLLNMTAMLRRRWASGHRGMGSICWTCFLLLSMAAAASAATAASFTQTVYNTSLVLSLGWVMMQGNFDIPVFSSRRGGGRRAGG